MIEPSVFFNELKKKNIDFYTGVPDSLLKSFCSFVDDNSKKNNHIITANEGNAIALAAGYHLSTKKIPVVYMQNSGLGNCINPLTSLADKEVYGIPMIMMIGWRGQPGFKDEPQHIKQGRITKGQLDLLGIKYFVISAKSNPKSVIKNSLKETLKQNCPVAILVKKDTFSNYELKKIHDDNFELSREEAIRSIIEFSNEKDCFISTTGKTSRELYEIREERKEPQRDFLSVGSMGHVSSIALGVSIGNKKKKIICLDGDGSFLMHMGSAPIIGSVASKNFLHIILNNGCHESVGGQPTVARRIDFLKLSKSINYKNSIEVSSKYDLPKAWKEIYKKDGPNLLIVNISAFSRNNLGRPKTSANENKNSFMDNLNKKRD